MTRKNLVGIDLGTSYSSLSALDANLEARPVANGEGDYKTPSVVYFAEEGSGVVVGQNALKPGFTHPERLVAHAKRYLGDPDACWEIDGVFYSPVDVSAFVLGKLFRDAENELGPIREAVITVPAHFNDHQRKLTIRAGEQAGLETVHLLNEPVAAALCFALGTGGKEMLYLHDDCTVLIYDLGGGTFDLSLVRFDRKQLRVLATSGELLLGGLDWDQRLLDRYAASFRVMHATDLARPEHRNALRRLSLEVEGAKRRLSDPAIAKTGLEFQYRGKEAEFDVVREEFEFLTTDLVRRTEVLTESLMKSSRVEWAEVDSIIPIGGATRMPMIRRLIEKFSNRGPIVRPLSPDLSVSMGAALFAGVLEGKDESFLIDTPRGRALAEFKTTVVSGRSLGLWVRHKRKGVMFSHELIPRNAALPASASVTVATHKPNQSHVSMKVVECDGENGRVPPVVCKCTLGDLPPGLPEGSRFDVEVSYNTQGLIQVIAKHRESGRLASINTFHEAAQT
jgi:molecular chaperone DnaK